MAPPPSHKLQAPSFLALPQPAGRAMASTPRAPAAQTQTQTQTVLPDEIWEDILLRLDAAADLARASAACSSFRRIVSARRFLRRFRSLHSPPLLGFIRYEYRDFLPVVPPHRSAPEARALVQAADFTFSFLPDPSEWCFCHASDGRVLLSRRISYKTWLLDFVVCDPLHRRYVKIPRIPDDLMAASTPNAFHLLPVLAPAADDDEEESFRVICAVHSIGKGKVAVFIFSSGNQTWRAIISMISLPNGFIVGKPYYAHGCLYWMFCDKGYSLMLDTSEMKFSIIDLPPHNFDSMFAIVEATDGRLGFLTLGDGTIDLYCKNLQNNAVGTQEWLHNKLIPLPKESGINYDWQIDDIAGHYLYLVAYHGDDDESTPNSEDFVLDIKTLLVEKLCSSNNGMLYGGFPYARFPPPLALPSI